MQSLRRLALNHRRLAALVFVLALLAKVLVPAGYMPSVTGKTITVAMCNGMGPLTISIPGTEGKQVQQTADHPCLFAGLGSPGLAAADVAPLVAALLFAFVLALSPIQLPALRRTQHLRPPLRGPPAFA